MSIFDCEKIAKGYVVVVDGGGRRKYCNINDIFLFLAMTCLHRPIKYMQKLKF